MENNEQSKRKVTPKKRKNEKQIIYVGPNLSGGLLQKYKIFKGGTPPELGQLFEKEPLLKQLFVPVEQLAEAEKDLATAGTLLHTAYREFTGERKEVTDFE